MLWCTMLYWHILYDIRSDHIICYVSIVYHSIAHYALVYHVLFKDTERPSIESRADLSVLFYTRQKFIHRHQWMFTVSNRNTVYSILNNWCICVNISCGFHRPPKGGSGKRVTFEGLLSDLDMMFEWFVGMAPCVYIYIYIYICIYIYMYVYRYVYTSVYIYIYIYIERERYTYIYIYIYTYVSVYIYIYSYIYIYIRVYIYIYIYIYTHIHIQLCISICI